MVDEEEGNRHRHGQALVAETTADADAALRGARGLYEKLRSGAVKDGMAREKISEPVHVFELELEIRGESVHSTMGTSCHAVACHPTIHGPTRLPSDTLPTQTTTQPPQGRDRTKISYEGHLYLTIAYLSACT